jgi:hypothetical protein
MHDLTSATSALLMTTSAVPLSSAKVTADVSLTFRSAQTLPQLSELSLLGDRWATQERMFYGFCMFLRQNRTKSAKGKRKEQGKKCVATSMGNAIAMPQEGIFESFAERS